MCIRFAATMTTAEKLTHWGMMDKKSPRHSKTDWRQEGPGFARRDLYKKQIVRININCVQDETL